MSLQQNIVGHVTIGFLIIIASTERSIEQISSVLTSLITLI